MESHSDHISEQLQQARERAGLTIDDVHFKTCIPNAVLQALEAGDFEVFSSPTYARSFLSQYGEFLGVDTSEWLDALQPGAFIADSLVHPWVDEPVEHHQEPEAKAPVKQATPAWLSAACILVLSCGTVVAALKGYNYFEQRYGNEPKSLNEVAVTPYVETPPAAAPAPRDESKPAEISAVESVVTTTALEAAPRAIIVR